MGWEPLKPGDVIIQGSFHALMWVGGEKPVVHNIEQGKFVGVIRQSDSYVRQHSNCAVFRFEDEALAAKAAEYAIEWSAAPGTDFVLPEEQPNKVVLKTLYSHRRMGEALLTDDRPWTLDSLFRALKAVARKRDQSGLSPNHGVTCSQFVTYCYQAAALEQQLGPIIPEELLTAIRLEEPSERPLSLYTWAQREHLTERQSVWRAQAYHAQTRVFKRLTQDREFLHSALTPYFEALTEKIPSGLRVDAKLTTVDVLLENLEVGGSGFTRIGVIADRGEGLGLAILTD